MSGRYSDETADLFPDMPREPVPAPRAELDDVPEEIRAVVRGLRKMARQRYRAEDERLQLKEAARLLVEGWGNR